MIKPPELVVIDLDGTLVDSVPDLAYCADQMMLQLNLPERGESEVRKWVGNGVERLVSRTLAGSLDGEVAPEMMQKALPIFMAFYADNFCKRSQLYPGIREGLEVLRARGYPLACVTNKPAAFTEPLLKELGIYESFGLVVSGDTLAKKKPDPLPLLFCAEHFAVKPENSLMVGDSVNDVTAARAAGFQIVCVTYGYNHGEDIGDAAPDALLDSLHELQYLLEPE